MIGAKFIPWDFSLVASSAQTTSLCSQFVRKLPDQEFKRKSTLCVYKVPKEYEIIRKGILKDRWEQCTDQDFYWREKALNK